jgi:RNA polymerase sigma-70 factor (ECF subfamily)
MLTGIGGTPSRRPYGPPRCGPDSHRERQLDPEALGDHIDRLYRAAWSLSGSREEAEDLVQETFLSVLRKPRTLHAQDDVGYLLRSLRHTFLNARRASARRPDTAVSIDGLELEDTQVVGPERAAEASALYEAIAALPQRFRDALIAVDVIGLSYREAARALRVREATVTTRLYRARQRVAVALA